MNLHEDLLVTALEGGSNYWYSLGSLSALNHIPPMEFPTSERIYKGVMEGIEINVFDVEDRSEKLGVISKEGILTALEKMKNIVPHEYENIMDDNWDAASADVWFQIAVMGEVVYG